MKTFIEGQRVKYLSGGKNFQPIGIVVEVQSALGMNGTILSGEKYKVKWETTEAKGETSGWLSAHDLEAVFNW